MARYPLDILAGADCAREHQVEKTQFQVNGASLQGDPDAVGRFTELTEDGHDGILSFQRIQSARGKVSKDKRVH